MLLTDGFTVVDTESTGIDVLRDRVIEFGWSRFDEHGVPVDTDSMLINPGVRWERGRFVIDGQDGAGIQVPIEAFNIHGIHENDVDGLPGLRDAWPKIESHLHVPTVSYNGMFFDLPIMRREFERIGMTLPAVLRAHVDLYPFVSWHFRGLRSRKLGSLCALFKIGIDGDAQLHRAGTDCALTGKLLMKLIDAGVVPRDVRAAYDRMILLGQALEEESARFMYWFYEDRSDGSLRMGCGRHVGKLVSEVPKKEWTKLLGLAKDAPEHIRAMFTEFSK